MITETAQTQQLTSPSPEGGVRTPAEIMVTVLAQTIIITCNPTPQQKDVLRRPFGIDNEQEGGKERTSEKKESREYSKSDLMKNSEAKSEETKTSKVELVHSDQDSKISTKTHTSKSDHPPKMSLGKENREPRSFEVAKQSTQPNLGKSQTVPPSQMSSLRHEKSRIAEEKGTSRRGITDQPLQNQSTENSPFHRLNKDPEQSPHKKRNFKRDKKNKIVGSEKVERVAERRFQPNKNADFESFLRTMMQDSDLSGFFGVRVSHFDVMLLFIELMKLEVEDNHQERTSRLEERHYQIVWMESVVKQYKSQAKLLLFAGVGAGVLGLVSGALPIIGHVGGDFILDKLKMVYSGFEGMKRAKVFDNLSKMCFSMSEMNKAMGQVQSSFCEGERSWAEHKSSLHRTEGEESTRTIDERTREFKNWNEILAQLLRMEQDLVRQLYS